MNVHKKGINSKSRISSVLGALFGFTYHNTEKKQTEFPLINASFEQESKAMSIAIETCKGQATLLIQKLQNC
jgi:hypothetical protein